MKDFLFEWGGFFGGRSTVEKESRLPYGGCIVAFILHQIGGWRGDGRKIDTCVVG